MIEYKGKKGTIKQFAEEVGINPELVRDRLHRKWGIEDALETPVIQNIEVEYKGRNISIKQFSEESGLSTTTIYRRLKEGMSVEEIINTKLWEGNRTVRGLSSSETYSCWRSMHKRCYDKNHEAYSRYGEAGILVCKRWHKFLNFYDDMGARPSSEYSIERIDNFKGYSPENCRWATSKEQGANMKTNHLITYDGITLHVTGWEDRMGYNRGTIQNRLCHGWSEEKAIGTPVKEPPLFTYKGKTQRLIDWSRELKINYFVLQARLDREWSVKKAFSTPVRRFLPFVCGERRTYDKGCRCEKCRKANTEHYREYRNRRKKLYNSI